MFIRIAATLCVAAALVLPGTAAARPIDDLPVTKPAASPEPETVTVVRDSDDTVPLAVASAALVVAMASAGLTVVRRAPRKAHS
ncbi:MAG TPA: hypothetical protein VFX51_10245 [Solirubrobacteraceae bacterium]|nr:hypothetical protein [Solirubrobacteraceae bacterium]